MADNRRKAGGDRLADLDQSLIAAHKSDDKPRLVELYEAAGDDARQRGDFDRACFYFTHAYVFALETGSPRAESLRRILVAHGREL